MAAAFTGHINEMTTDDEVRLLELQLADIKRQIAYHEGALQDL
jgi:hypothetical protein